MTDLAGNLDQALNEAVNSAPVISRSPGLAVSVASSGGDTGGRAQAVAHASNGVALSNAATSTSQAAGTGLLGDVLNGVSDVVGGVGHVLNAVSGGAFNAVTNALSAPLHQVQHEYRYIHDVEATHGAGAAVLASLGLVGGAAAGFTLGGGPEGAILGAEGAEGIEANLLFRDSWNRANAANYVDPHTHQQVSFGRDVASLIGFKRNSGLFHLASGIGDAGFDLSLDPLATLGRLRTAAQDGKASGVVADLFPKIRPVIPEDVDQIYARYGNIRRAAQYIASRSTGEIAAEYPDMARSMFGNGQSVADALGRARTPEEVMQVYKDAVAAHALTQSDRLPSMAFTRLPFVDLRRWAQNQDSAHGEAIWNLADPRKLARHVADSFERLPFKTLTPADSSSTGDFYRLSRFTESNRTSALQATMWANATPGERILMFQNQLLRSIYALAGRPGDEGEFSALGDSAAKSEIKRLLEEATGGSRPGQNGTYGIDHELGLPSEPVVNESDGPLKGSTQQVAILQNQTGDLRVPNLADLRYAAKVLKAGKEVRDTSGFLYAHATQGFFKPLVLLTPAYAMHISLAELIPNSMRLGFRALVSSGIAVNRARLGAKADEGDLNALQGVVFRTLGGTRGQAMSSARTVYAARVADAYGADVIDPSLRAGEAYSKEVTTEEQVKHSLWGFLSNSRQTYQTSKFFGAFGKDEQHVDRWQLWLKEIANDDASRVGAQAYRDAAARGLSADEANLAGHQAVKEWLDGRDEAWLSNFARHTARTQTGIDNELSPHEDWARVVMSNLRAATTGSSGQVHPGLLSDIAEGKWSEAADLDRIPLPSRPSVVKGRVLVPPGGSLVQRIANEGFRRVLNPMVNFLSREPIFNAESFAQYERLVPAVEKGLMTDEQAFTLANSRAATIVMRNVHNLYDRTQWTVTMRNIAPFWFAQEQAYRRMGRLLAEDPGAFRRYQLAISGVHNVAFSQTDTTGNNYIVFPGSGFMTSGAAQAMQSIGLPLAGSSLIGTGFSLSSTSVMFPLANGLHPDIGPVAAIPTQVLSSLFPEMIHSLGGGPGATAKADSMAQALQSTALGGAAASQPIWEQLIPNSFVQRVVSAALGPNSTRAMASAMAETFQSLDYQQTQAMAAWEKAGSKGPPPEIIPPPTASKEQMQAFIDRVKNMTRVAFVTRAFLGLVTPIAPEVMVENWGLPAELNAAVAKHKNLVLGVQDFLRQHPNATPFTVFQSTGPEGPAPLASQQAEQWINSNIGMIKQFPLAGLYLMPQLKDTKYDASIYNQQLAQGLRIKYNPANNPWTVDGYRDPNSYLGQLYIAAGNSVYYNQALPAHQAAQAQLSGSDKSAEQHNWDTWLASFKLQNPIWADWHDSGDRTNRRSETIAQLQELYASGPPPGEMTTQVGSLLQDWNTYAASVRSARVNGTGGVTAAQTNWQNYLTQLKAKEPQLATVIDGVFMEAKA